LSDDFALAARAPAASEKQGSRNAVSRPGEKRLILRALAFKGIQDRRVFQAAPVDLIMRSFILLLTCLELAAQMAAQAGTPHFAQPMPMPADRSEDSYAIYSQLLKSGPIEWRDVSRRHWLIEDTTNATPLDMACHAAPGVNSIEINPHEVVQAPKNRQTEWNEVLTDYDQHCHDVIQLDVQSFRTELPVRLLNTEDKHSFMRDPGNPPPEFADGAGLHRFTEVFFNANHTLALVEEGMWCGSLCGNWTWVVLERRDGRWQMMPWVNATAVS
jgi:hypothetical protein